MLTFLARIFLLLAAAFSLGLIGGRGTRRTRPGGAESASAVPKRGARPEGNERTDTLRRVSSTDGSATATRTSSGQKPELVAGASQPTFASYGGSGFSAAVILDGDAGKDTSLLNADPELLAAPDPHGRTGTAEARLGLPDDPLASRHGSDELDFRTVDYGNAKAAERSAAEARSRDDGWTVPEETVGESRPVYDESPAAFKSGGGSGTVHGAPDPDASHGDADAVQADGTTKTQLGPSSADQGLLARRETARDGVPDDLTRIVGIGPSIERLLFDNGVFHFQQIAGWSTEQERWADDLTGFRGRAVREKWAEQAARLVQPPPL